MLWNIETARQNVAEEGTSSPSDSKQTRDNLDLVSILSHDKKKGAQVQGKALAIKDENCLSELFSVCLTIKPEFLKTEKKTFLIDEEQFFKGIEHKLI